MSTDGTQQVWYKQPKVWISIAAALIAVVAVGYDRASLRTAKQQAATAEATAKVAEQQARQAAKQTVAAATQAEAAAAQSSIAVRQLETAVSALQQTRTQQCRQALVKAVQNYFATFPGGGQTLGRLQNVVSTSGGPAAHELNFGPTGDEMAASILAHIHFEEALALEPEVSGDLTYADYLIFSGLAFGLLGLEEAEHYADKAVESLPSGDDNRRAFALTMIGSLYTEFHKTYPSPNVDKARSNFEEAERSLRDLGENKLSLMVKFTLYAEWALFEYSFSNKGAGDNALKRAEEALARIPDPESKALTEKELEQQVKRARIRGGIDPEPKPDPPPTATAPADRPRGSIVGVAA